MIIKMFMHLQMLTNCQILCTSPQSSLQTTYTYKVLVMSILNHSFSPLLFSYSPLANTSNTVFMCDCIVKFHVRGFVTTSAVSNSDMVFGITIITLILITLPETVNKIYRISRPIRRTFFPEKCDINLTCVLCVEGKYYF